MTNHSHRAAGLGWRVAHVVVLFAAFAGNGLAADVHFPEPLHLTRRIDEPISGTTITVEEYCAGNRVVTVRGDRLVIVDYDRSEVTEIDRATGTYSVTGFDEIARVTAKSAPAAKSSAATPRVVSLGTRSTENGRRVDRFEIAAEDETVHVDVDRSVTLSRAALDVLLGAAYPARPSAHHEELIRAAARSAPRGPGTQTYEREPETYGLPVEHSTTSTFEGTSITIRSVIIRVGDERAPPELLSIPPGAVRVESRSTAAARLTDELDGRAQRP
jgi:hypothetical protein